MQIVRQKLTLDRCADTMKKSRAFCMFPRASCTHPMVCHAAGKFGASLMTVFSRAMASWCLSQSKFGI